MGRKVSAVKSAKTEFLGKNLKPGMKIIAVEIGEQWSNYYAPFTLIDRKPQDTWDVVVHNNPDFEREVILQPEDNYRIEANAQQ